MQAADPGPRRPLPPAGHFTGNGSTVEQERTLTFAELEQGLPTVLGRLAADLGMDDGRASPGRSRLRASHRQRGSGLR